MNDDSSSATTPRVAYVVSEKLVKVATLLPSNRGRASIVHSLANALGFFKRDILPNLKALLPSSASVDEMCTFHDSEYIDFLLLWKGQEEEEEEAEEYGLAHDCPYFPGLPQYAAGISGAVLEAVKVLKSDQANVAIVWDGGRHHASKSLASGYCYVNDCNLAILNLRRAQPRPRVLYIDLDLHFSDGVTEAFLSTSTTPSVLTLSIHHAAPGFFPISEHAELTSLNTSSPFSLSIPLMEGTSNATYARVWSNCVEPVKDAFRPDVVVVQCGVDGLAGDPCAVWNLGLDVKEAGSLGWVVQRILSWGKKTLLLGGGGYDSHNAARAWAYMTSIACGTPLDIDTPIPEHSFFPEYAPSFALDVPPGHRTDHNTEQYLEQVEARFASLVDRIDTLCRPPP